MTTGLASGRTKGAFRPGKPGANAIEPRRRAPNRSNSGSGSGDIITVDRYYLYDGGNDPRSWLAEFPGQAGTRQAM
jgi:hypothetical protein